MSGILAAAALDMQVDLLRFVKSDTGHQLCRSMARVIDSGEGLALAANGARFHDEAEAERYAKVMWQAQYLPLDHGETFGVAAEIHEIIDAASETLPEFTLHESDVPAQRGFIFLEEPILIRDHRDQLIVVKGISWSAAATEVEPENPVERTGVVLIPWTDPFDPRDHMHAERDHVSRLKHRPPLAFLGMCIHDWDTTVSDAAPDPFKTKMLKYLYTLWRFMSETWVDGRAILPDRPAQKRAIRAGRPSAEVRVVRLRKREQSRNPDSDPMEDDDILWSHRWLVHGHWRNQWYPSQDRHAPKWISGYIKGPDHLPLIVKDVVHVVDR